MFCQDLSRNISSQLKLQQCSLFFFLLRFVPPRLCFVSPANVHVSARSVNSTRGPRKKKSCHVKTRLSVFTVLQMNSYWSGFKWSAFGNPMLFLIQDHRRVRLRFSVCSLLTVLLSVSVARPSWTAMRPPTSCPTWTPWPCTTWRSPPSTPTSQRAKTSWEASARVRHPPPTQSPSQLRILHHRCFSPFK